MWLLFYSLLFFGRTHQCSGQKKRVNSCINNNEQRPWVIAFFGDKVIEISFSRIINCTLSTSHPQFPILSFALCCLFSSQLECFHTAMAGAVLELSPSLFFKSRTASRLCQQIKLNWSLLQWRHSTQALKWCWQLSQRPHGNLLSQAELKTQEWTWEQRLGVGQSYKTINTKDFRYCCFNKIR